MAVDAQRVPFARIGAARHACVDLQIIIQRQFDDDVAVLVLLIIRTWWPGQIEAEQVVERPGGLVRRWRRWWRRWGRRGRRRWGRRLVGGPGRAGVRGGRRGG